MSIEYYFQPREGVDQSQLKIAKTSIYSITPWKEANFVSRMILNFYGPKRLLKPLFGYKPVITDATAHVGGNTISFHMFGFQTVHSVDCDREIADMLVNNLTTYHYPTDHVVCRNYLDVYLTISQDVVFLDPPWGGVDYHKSACLDLYIGNVNVITICRELLDKRRATLIVIKAPINFNINALIADLANKQVLIQKIHRNARHSYNIIFCW
jgi:hypothetical protein